MLCKRGCLFGKREGQLFVVGVGLIRMDTMAKGVNMSQMTGSVAFYGFKPDRRELELAALTDMAAGIELIDRAQRLAVSTQLKQQIKRDGKAVRPFRYACDAHKDAITEYRTKKGLNLGSGRWG